MGGTKKLEKVAKITKEEKKTARVLFVPAEEESDTKGKKESGIREEEPI